MKKSLIILFISLMVLPQLAHGGAWTLPDGDIWGEYTSKWNWNKDNFNTHTDRSRNFRDARSWGWSQSLKFEYGIWDWLTAMFGIEYKNSHYKEYSRNPGWGPYSVKNHGVGSIEIGLKERILEKPFVASVQFKASINLWEDDDALDRANQPGLTDQTNWYEVRGLIGKKFETAIPSFFGIESGYRWNVHQIEDQIPLFVEAGFWPYSWILIKTELDNLFHSSGARTDERTPKSYGIWRIGPTFDLLELYDLLVEGNAHDEFADPTTEPDAVTRQGRSLDLSIQYGHAFWGRNSAADREAIIKIAGQY